ncbi:MAG: FluC/FEX family fluoride channel [Bacteroidota bacterium]
MQFANLFAVLIGGALGSLLRWLISFKIPFEIQQFSWGTFVVNMVACLLMGTLYPRLSSDFWRLLLFTGLLGGFSTFSGLVIEIIQYCEHQEYRLAVIYGLTSLIFGILLAWLGQRFSVLFS